MTRTMLAGLVLLAAALQGAQAASGKAVYEKVCIACHAVENVMVAAPKLGDKAEWAKRQAKGSETLLDHAVKGFGAMPPKGGSPELTREELRSAIGYMIAPPGPSDLR